MNKNKGTIGEMRVVKLLADISIAKDGCDFTRPTNTNTPDMGADLIFEHPKAFLEEMQLIASGNAESSISAPSINDTSTVVKSRIDVKNTDKKLLADTVDKFAGDVRKHPDCVGHILMGGAGLTAPAQEKFNQLQESASQDGKKVIYVPNAGVANLTNYFASLPAPSSNFNDDSSDDESS